MRWRNLLPKLLLGVTSALFFVVTGWMLLRQLEQDRDFRANFRTSGWAAYQAEREFGRTVAALRIASIQPSGTNIDDALLRLEIFASRLPILLEGSEGLFLREMMNLPTVLAPVAKAIDESIDEIGTLVPERPDTGERLRVLDVRLREFAPVLQNLVQTAVVYNERFYALEEKYRGSAPFIPLGLLFVSGAVLVTLLTVEARRGRRRLHEMSTARRAMEATEASLRNLVEAVPVGILIYSTERDRIEFINPSAARRLPYDNAEGSREWYRQLRRGMAVLDGLNEIDRRRPIKLNVQSRGEALTLQVVERRISWNGEPCLMYAFYDLTRLQIAERQVLQAAQLSQLGEMATSIAHEINQPLTVIALTAANLKLRLKQPMPGPDELAAKIERIEGQVTRARRITDQMRRYGRAPTVSGERFSIRGATDLAVGFMQDQFRIAGLRIAVASSLDEEDLVVGEQVLFEQVIVNLLANARDALLENRQGAGAGPEEADVTLRLERRERLVLLEVSDRGGGIPQGVIERIFAPFFTSKPAGKGTGLGLAFCRNVIGAMGGSIDVRNDDAGAVFTIMVPAVSAGEAPLLSGANAA